MDKAIAPAPAFVGIDVAKHSLDIHSRPSGESFAVDYDEEGVAALVGRLAALAPTLVVLEATGGMEVRLAAALAAAGLPVAVVNPRQVRAFARATGRLAHPPRGGRPGRGGAVQPRQRRDARQAHGVGWPGGLAGVPLHGRGRGRARQQPGDHRLLPAPASGGKAGQAGADGLHAQAGGDAQRHAPRRHCLEAGLTPDTVVLVH
jgi:hypothetical protein